MSASCESCGAGTPTLSAHDDLIASRTNHSHASPTLQNQYTPSSPHVLPDHMVVRPSCGKLDRVAWKTYVISRRGLKTDMQIVHVQNELEVSSYYASVKAWKLNTPDVTLHAGADTAAEIVGVAYFRYSWDIMLGLGDPLDDPSSVTWEALHRQALLKNKWTFEFDDSPGRNVATPRLGTPTRRHFIWQRTNDAADGVEGISRMSMRNFRLNDQDTGDVVAVFLASNLTSLRKKGELRIFRELSIGIEKIVLLSCVSISEKMSRD